MFSSDTVSLTTIEVFSNIWIPPSSAPLYTRPFRRSPLRTARTNANSSSKNAPADQTRMARATSRCREDLRRPRALATKRAPRLVKRNLSEIHLAIYEPSSFDAATETPVPPPHRRCAATAHADARCPPHLHD